MSARASAAGRAQNRSGAPQARGKVLQRFAPALGAAGRALNRSGAPQARGQVLGRFAAALGAAGDPAQNSAYTNGATIGTACSSANSSAVGSSSTTSGAAHQYGPYHSAITSPPADRSATRNRPNIAGSLRGARSGGTRADYRACARHGKWHP